MAMDFGTIFLIGAIAFILWAVADNFIGGVNDDKKASFKVWLLAGAIGLGILVLFTMGEVI
jgi:hypothetical protein